MDLGISGKRALVCASSKGLGRGCAEMLAANGVNLVMNARGSEALENAAAEIREVHGVDVLAIAADITTEEGRAKVLEAAGDVDILVNNAGGPPPGTWQDWEREDFIKALDARHDGTRMGQGGEHHLAIREVPDCGSGPVELGPRRSDGLCCWHLTAGRKQRRDHQQPASRHPCHGSGGVFGQHSRCAIRDLAGGSHGPESRNHPRRPLWYGGGIRRYLRVPMLSICGLYGRAEHPSGRRRDEFDAVETAISLGFRHIPCEARPVSH